MGHVILKQLDGKVRYMWDFPSLKGPLRYINLAVGNGPNDSVGIKLNLSPGDAIYEETILIAEIQQSDKRMEQPP